MTTLASLVIPLVLDTSQFVKGIDEATKKSSSLTSVLNKAGPAALGVLTGFFVGATEATFNWAESLDGVQDIMGGTTEQAAGLAVLFQRVGMTTDDLTGAMEKMVRGLETSNGSLGTSGLALQSLGISAFDATGNIRPAVDIFQEVSDRLSVMPEGLEKTSLMMDIFGKSGAEMGDAMGLAAGSGLAAANTEAERMNLNFSQEKTDNIIKSQQGINDLKTAFSGLGTDLVTSALPAMDKLVLALRWLIDNKPILYGVIVTLGAIAVSWLVSVAVAGWAAIAPFAPFIAIIAGLIFIIAKVDDVWKIVIGTAEAFFTTIKLIAPYVLKFFQPVIDGIAQTFVNIGEAVKGVIGWVEDLFNAIKNIELPDWLTPGSPTPFELGLRGIGSALQSLNETDLPNFNARLNIQSGMSATRQTNDATSRGKQKQEPMEISDKSIRKLGEYILTNQVA